MHITSYIQRRNPFGGFTLVETLVAVTILLTVVIGPMTIASRGLQNAYFAGDQTTAIYLAQEAVESIQRLRDDNALEAFDEFQSGNTTVVNTANWYYTNAILSDSCRDNFDDGGCDIDLVNGGYRDCSVLSQCRLRVSDSPTGGRVYGYGSTGSGWEDSRFTRIIRVGDPVGGSGSSIGGVPVSVTVEWDAGQLFGGTRSIVLQTYIYDHYTRYE